MVRLRDQRGCREPHNVRGIGHRDALVAQASARDSADADRRSGTVATLLRCDHPMASTLATFPRESGALRRVRVIVPFVRNEYCIRMVYVTRFMIDAEGTTCLPDGSEISLKSPSLTGAFAAPREWLKRHSREPPTQQMCCCGYTV